MSYDLFLIFKKKTAYELRIIDWSSDVCSSDLMAERKVLPYLDVPFQHASTRVLKAMKRPAASEDTLKRIRAWRSICPDLSIRSTFIVGFPGETELDLQLLPDWLDEELLDRVGRSDERRLGKERLSTFKFRWVGSH